MTTKDLVKNECECAVDRTHERVVTPKVNVIEKEEGYHIEAEMPGVSEKDVDVELKSRHLRVTGKRNGENHTILYERAFRLPDGIDSDRVEATMANGILKLVIPRSEATRPRAITVKAG